MTELQFALVAVVLVVGVAAISWSLWRAYRLAPDACRVCRGQGAVAVSWIGDTQGDSQKWLGCEACGGSGRKFIAGRPE